jgi:predicted O-methyltransferase YrrM
VTSDVPLQSAPDEIDRARRQIEELIGALPQHAKVNAILKDLRQSVERDWQASQHAVNTLVRLQTARGLAAQFMERLHPYKDSVELSALIERGLLHHSTFIQKSPSHLRFYKALLASIEPSPRRILEIGVKGGGSVAFWKALYPDAEVVGLDIKLRAWLRSAPSADGVIYLQGDQCDIGRLSDVAEQHGPFDLVIDDGSHVSRDQATTIRALLPRVQSGGFYVIEDTHTALKEQNSRDVEYGPDIWNDFTLTLLQRLRRGPLPAESEGVRLARQLSSRIAEVRFARQILAVRVKDETADA